MCTICTRFALPLIVQELVLAGIIPEFPFYFHCRVVTDRDAVY